MSAVEDVKDAASVERDEQLELYETRSRIEQFRRFEYNCSLMVK